MNDRQKLEQLRAFVNLSLSILLEIHGRVDSVAHVTGLSAATIYRLCNDQYSLRVQWRTIQAIADAAGFVFTMNNATAKVGLKIA